MKNFLQPFHFIYSLLKPLLRKMDFLKKVANQQQGNAATQQGDAAAQQANNAAGGEHEDYADKGSPQKLTLGSC